MKQIASIFLFALLFSLNACNNGTEVKQPEAKAPDTVAAAPVVAAKPAFVPFKGMVVQHHVKNFGKWLAVFQADDSLRKAYGITDAQVARGLADSNVVIAFFKFDDIAKAKDFIKLPALKANMKKGGVNGPVTIDYVDVIRNTDSPIDTKVRMVVIHHVKDYDAWVKVYDGEGLATRASYGMVDRALARGVTDPNLVYIVFAITDMEKAKARGASADLKKIMKDAGVDGPVKQFAYKFIE